MTTGNPLETRPVSRRTVLAGGAALLVGSGLLAPATARAAGRCRPSDLTPAQRAGSRQ